jgi:hypothetical protein
MKSTKLACVLGACSLVAVPAAALAAGAVHPRSGKFTGTPHYKVSGKPESATLTLTVAKGKIKQVDIIAAVLPLDPTHSHGVACGSANDISSSGDKSAGTVSKSGQFNYTFTNKSKNFSDRITLVGRFTDPTHATGTFRDHSTIPVANSKCDSGKVKFSVKHS